MTITFDRLDHGLLKWFFETYIPRGYYVACKQVNKRWHRIVGPMYTAKLKLETIKCYVEYNAKHNQKHSSPEQWIRYLPGYFDEVLMMDAVCSRDIRMMRHVNGRGAPITNNVLWLAVEHGSMYVLEWFFVTKRYRVAEEMIALAQSKRNDDVIDWLRDPRTYSIIHSI